MKFLTPILQGLIVLLIMGALGWGLRSYGQFNRIAYTVSTFDERLKSLEEQIKALKTQIEKVPLCQR